MIGQTGRSVAPRLYLALGISGSMHHIGASKDSRRIVALNSDTKAPIFANADEGFVADLKDVLPGSWSGAAGHGRHAMKRSFQAIVVGRGRQGPQRRLGWAAGLDVALWNGGTFRRKGDVRRLLHRLHSLEEIFPDFWDRAPWNGHIARRAPRS